VLNGQQGAIMAPTSILAEQHYRGLSRAFGNLPQGRRPVIGLLTSALSTTERSSIYRGLEDGSIDIIVGTHALIQQGVDFKHLAVAVIDEQHRFGVEQRKMLRGKGTNPHLLAMTATPIPRTLSLTIYADLDLSILDEMPPNRTPIKTRIVRPVGRESAYEFIEKQLAAGRQAFVVHPLVEESEKTDARAALQAYDELKVIFHRNRVGLLHGRMRAAEKDEAMRAFGAHEFDILVTTSVAEVGVDVPNASVMMIENAERFGLAQLHQFRGRVGRGQHASYCLLVTEEPDGEFDEVENERLQALVNTTDGFKLAEIDWELRGAGDLLGTTQSGGSTLGVRGALGAAANLLRHATPQLVQTAQREARTLYEQDPNLDYAEHRLLAQRVAMLYNQNSDIS
jgi:ATP-dependent DNA helicase RecG